MTEFWYWVKEFIFVIFWVCIAILVVLAMFNGHGPAGLYTL